MEKDRLAVVVVVDRLGASFLGPYGNTWLETPHFNQLAAESLLIEFPIVDSLELAQSYRGYWHGLHTFCGRETTSHSLPSSLDDHGVPSTLLTDVENPFQSWERACQFGRRIDLPRCDSTALAERVEQTHFAQFFAAAAEEVARLSPPHLIWIHSGGMQGSWDAPYDLRFQFTDDDDPEPPRIVQPPSQCTSGSVDPDELLGLTFAYAGQVTLLDMCLGVLLESAAELAGQTEMLLLLTSTRGYPLGEHGRIGASQPALYGESLHVPWMMKCSQTAEGGFRSQAIVQPHCAFETLLDWFGLPPPTQLFYSTSLLSLRDSDRSQIGDRACSQLGQQRSIRTPAWFLRQASNGCELYAKPDDRWEVNEVADRCPEVVEELVSLLDEFAEAAQSSKRTELTALSNALREGLDR